MDVKLINPFIDATLHVLATVASTEVKPGKPYLKEDHVARGDVSGMIRLTGEASGTISVSFTEKCILAIVSRMFKEETNVLNAEIQDAVGEITNIISGQARQKLEEFGKSLKAAIPTVTMGKNHSIIHITTGPKIAIPFDTKNGEFTIEICFKE